MAERKPNQGPGAGAINRGKDAGSRIEVDDKGISKLTTGNINKGPGAGAINQGERAGCIIVQRPDLGTPFDGNAAEKNDKAKKIHVADINQKRLIGHKKEIDFKLKTDDFTIGEGKSIKEVQPNGNINIGPRVGRVNKDNESGSIISSVVGECKLNAQTNDDGNTKPPTGNINKGPGAGAINRGERAGCIIGHKKGINFISNDSTVPIPPHGNINKGPGAGGYNSGVESASIINCEEPKWS